MPETSPNPAYDISLRAFAPGRWNTLAAPEWRNPGDGPRGGYALGLCVHALEAEPEATGETLSMTLTYAAGLLPGELDVPTLRPLQGGSIGVWEVELRPQGVKEVGVHGMITLARQPPTPPFAFAGLPQALVPEDLPSPDHPAGGQHFGASVFERRTLDGFPPKPSGDSRSLAWVRPGAAPGTRRCWPWSPTTTRPGHVPPWTG